MQQPHPPLWVGAHGLAGVRRAGRFADKYATPPETTREQIAERFAIIAEEFAKRGKPFGPQSLRRNVLVADSKEEAIVEYARVAKGRYITYAQRGLDLYTGDQLEDDFYSTVSDHAVLGSPDDVVAELTDYATRFPVDPILVRPQWPTMSADEAITAIDRYGRDVVPALAGLEPRQTL